MTLHKIHARFGPRIFFLTSVISIIRVKLNVDNKEEKQIPFKSGNRKIQTDPVMYVGGVPQDYKDKNFNSAARDLQTLVDGNIRDLIVNGR